MPAAHAAVPSAGRRRMIRLNTGRSPIFRLLPAFIMPGTVRRQSNGGRGEQPRLRGAGGAVIDERHRKTAGAVGHRMGKFHENGVDGLCTFCIMPASGRCTCVKNEQKKPENSCGLQIAAHAARMIQ